MLHKLRKTWYSLSGRLMVCLLVAVAGMTAVTLQAFVGSWQESRDQIYEDFAVVGDKMQSELSLTFTGFENVAGLVGYSSAVQRYLLSTDPELVIQSHSPAANYLETAIRLSDSCLNVFLYSYNGRHLSANTSYLEPFRQLLSNRGFDKDVTISRPFFARFPGDKTSSFMFYCVPIFSVEHFYPQNRMLAAILFDMDELLERVSTSGPDCPDAAALLYDGSPVSSTRPLSEHERALIPSIPQDQGGVTFQGERYVTTRITMPERYWECVYFIPERELAGRVISSMNHGIIVMGMGIFLLSVFLTLLIRSINQSISQITRDMDALDYTATYHVRIPQLTELRTIAHAVNLMLDRLREVFQREQQTQRKLYEARQSQSRAKMMSYRSQINPHFLFNTLECMRSQAHNSGEGDIEVIISSMARMFRYSLYSKTTATLAEELSHVRNYFNVMKTRYPGQYRLRVSAGEEVMDFQMLSMVIQPIVENCISHGFLGLERVGRILIKAFQGERNCLVIQIADNGAGISAEELEALEVRMRQGMDEAQEGRSSIGLHNIYQRMKLVFGDHFHIRFRSREGMYTVVELIIPERPALEAFEEEE